MRGGDPEARASGATVAAAAGAVGAAALPFTAPAGALQSPGHVFSASFGGAGAGEGQLSEPSDVAIDEASGLAYVSDAGNERVEIFKREGPAQYEYVSQFKVNSPGPIAVDNSTSASDPTRGEVYVAGAAREEAEEGDATRFTSTRRP